MGSIEKSEYEDLRKFLVEECFSGYQFKSKPQTTLEAISRPLLVGKYTITPIQEEGQEIYNFQLKQVALFNEYTLVNFHFEHGVICAEKEVIKTEEDKQLVTDLVLFLEKSEYGNSIFNLESLVR